MRSPEPCFHGAVSVGASWRSALRLLKRRASSCYSESLSFAPHAGAGCGDRRWKPRPCRQSGSGRTGLGAHGPAVGVCFCPLWGSWTGWLLRVPSTQTLLFCSPTLCGHSSGREAVTQPVYVKKKTLSFQKEKIQY